MLIHLTPLLSAQTPDKPLLPWQELARDIWTRTEFSSDQMLPPQYLAFAAAVVLVLVVGLWLYRVYQQQSLLESAPLIQFHQFANSLRLSLRQQWLLVRIARHGALPSPLTLLVSPATLRHHALRLAHSQSPGARLRTLTRVKQISDRVFGRPHGSRPPAASPPATGQPAPATARRSA